jgi:L-asparaginase II
MTLPISHQSALSNPVLVEVWRGSEIESVHRGAACVADATGAIRAAWGDVDRPIYPRSAVKMIQVLPLLESGAADRFQLDDLEIAIACASHNGEREHARVVENWLTRIGVTCNVLECGCHQPFSEQAALDLAASHQTPTPLHNNCSGKHAGFITTALHLAIPMRDYINSSHPIQQHVTAALCEMTDFDLERAQPGIDGCGIPAYAIPLHSIARAMAKLASPSSLSVTRASGIRRIFHAMVTHPWLIGGTGRFDTEAMQMGSGEFVVKMGAEGVHVAVHPASGLGIALKIDDGTRRAADVAMGAMLQLFGFLADRTSPAHDALFNNRGEKVGVIRAVFPPRA